MAKPMSVTMPSPKANTVVSMLIAPARGRFGGLSATSARTPSSATATPATPPEHRQQQAFREQLSDQAPSRGAQCGAQRELVTPVDRARQQQVRDIHTRDHQHEDDRAED